MRKGCICLLFDVGPPKSRSFFNPTVDKLPDSHVDNSVAGKWSPNGRWRFCFFFGARSVRLVEGLHCLLFDVGPLIRRSSFIPTVDVLPGSCVGNSVVW